ncbi:hypothetical protein M2Y25_18130 [Klebsiella pneumoniae]|nr:hypothetical protein [Klebsiella pneumoniae]
MESKLLENKDINKESLKNVFDNAGIKTDIINDDLVIQKDNIKSIVYCKPDVVSIISNFRLKPDLDEKILQNKLVDLNHGAYPHRFFLSSDKKTLAISITYLTSVGIYIPQFVLSTNAYFAFILLDFKRIDCSDILM